MTRMLVVVAFCLLAAAGWAAEVYKTVDEHGRVTYSDQPQGDNSEKVEMGDPNTVPAPEVKEREKSEEGGEGEDEANNQIPNSYQVQITSPPDEHHLTAGTFDLSVQVATQPPLHDSHILRVLDNGDPIDGMYIENIIRGSHKLQAVVVNQNGQILGRSEPVDVYVHRPSVAN